MGQRGEIRQSSSCGKHSRACIAESTNALINLVCICSQPAAVVMTNCEKSEDRLSENVEGVKEAKIVKARDTPNAACILLTVKVPSKK